MMPHYGETIDTLCQQRDLSVSEILSIGTQLLTALEDTHKAGYVHNDIKPDNIVVSGSKTTLIDFGCATQYMARGIHIKK